jgi:2-aminoadipate transaminase
MLDSMNEHLPDSVDWTKPQGGLFLWVTLPENIDTTEMLQYAVAKNVAYVTGRAFYAIPDDGKNKMRLNFSYCPPDVIKQGIEILGNVIQFEISKKVS